MIWYVRSAGIVLAMGYHRSTLWVFVDLKKNHNNKYFQSNCSINEDMDQRLHLYPYKRMNYLGSYYG